MAWTYQFDEYDKDVTKDTSTEDRYTFNRYMYFKPDQYENWSKNRLYSGVPYTAELVGNSTIPSPGTHLSGSLSAFYVNEVLSITNLSEEEHGDHCSYAVVTIEYENKISSSKYGDGTTINVGVSTSQPSGNLPPWEKVVDDFSVINQEVSIPLTEAYEKHKDEIIPVATTAGQVLYGFTAPFWIQKVTWTWNTKSDDDYSLTGAIINASDEEFLNGFYKIPAGNGLLLPPSYKRLYWTDGTYINEPYNQWSFEIIVDSRGFDIDVLNAGTKAIISGELVDICTWYVYDPLDTDVPEKNFGSFGQMMAAKLEVDEYNKAITDETKKKQWHGDYVQSPIPIKVDGGIDLDGIEDPKETYVRNYCLYDIGVWDLGGV